MGDGVDAVCDRFRDDLAKGAAGYLRAGMTLFHAHASTHDAPQACLGTIAISVELMLKALAADISPTLVFTALPLDLRVGLLARRALPATYTPPNVELLLRRLDHKSIDLAEAFSVFGQFQPELRRELKTHFESVRLHRNACVHLVGNRACATFELERAVYVALRVHQEVSKSIAALQASFPLGVLENAALASFDEARTKRVQTAIAQAHKKAERNPGPVQAVNLDASWESEWVACPACGKPAQLTGEVELSTRATRDEQDVIFTLWGSELLCPTCDLKLTDSKELELAGVKTSYDRSQFERAAKEWEAYCEAEREDWEYEQWKDQRMMEEIENRR